MALKRTVSLRKFSISRHQIWCAHAIVDQRMHACASKMPSCFFNTLDPSAYGFRNARKLWETLRLSSQNLAIWASQRMLFDPTKTFCFFYIYFIAKVLCCFGIRTEEIQLMALRNIQISKALVVAVKRSQSQIWDLKFAYAWQLIKYFCGLLHEAVSETRMAC